MEYPVKQFRTIFFWVVSVGLLGITSVEAQSEVKSFVYISTIDGKVTIYGLDSETGELEHVQSVSTEPSSFFMAANPNKSVLYVGHRGNNISAISAHTINPSNGLLTHINSIDIPAGPVHMYVDKTSRYIFSAPYSITTATISPLAVDGRLLDPVTSIRTDVQPHQLVLDNTNKFAYIPCLGSDNIHLYRFDEESGELSPNQPQKLTFTRGSGPRLLEFHGAKNFVYLASELNNTIGAYAINQTDGTLSEINTLSTLPENFSRQNTVSEIHITPNNKYIYVGNRGHNSIAAYVIDDETGAVERIDTYATENTPRSFAISPNGHFLFAAGKSSGTMAAYKISEETGGLTKYETLTVGPEPNCVLALRLGEVIGCTDPNASNYDTDANTPCDSCCEEITAKHPAEKVPSFGISLDKTFLKVSIPAFGTYRLTVHDVTGKQWITKQLSGQGIHALNATALPHNPIVTIQRKSGVVATFNNMNWR